MEKLIECKIRLFLIKDYMLIMIISKLQFGKLITCRFPIKLTSKKMKGTNLLI